MPMIHYACALDSFRISLTGHGAFGDEFRLEGWVAGEPMPARVELVFAGDHPMSFEVHNRDRESAGVFKFFGHAFGGNAQNCRFLLAEKIPSPAPDWQAARLRITGPDGRVVEIAVDPPENLDELHASERAGADLLMRFESCGDSCEFGLLQRKLGRERMSLLRYAGVADVFLLADAIRARFEGFAEGDTLVVHPFGAEWMAALPMVRMNLHTGRELGHISQERILVEERRKLQFLSQKFVDDLEDGEKIFVYRTLRDERGGPDGLKGRNQLFDAMRSVGPARLLWVNEADATHPAGSVREISSGLFHGHVRRLAPRHDAFGFDAEGWLEMLTEAAAAIDAATARDVAAGAALTA